MKSDYLMMQAHRIRTHTNNKYDIIDVLEMEPYRRQTLVASIQLEIEEAAAKPKGKGQKGGN